ncbi:expressed unknown protein [Seminavis robusta]|uniref:Uncharacterized protein n=1 Tax=Seminavis robusta TaxID=568900 RepID=A0A9N8EWA1_9STRA|nr:expressed unknown protein [Seminavis robusta]|eukprot:Sro1792_g297910.1 n/a (397) ;mRNA; r:21071-22261
MRLLQTRRAAPTKEPTKTPASSTKKSSTGSRLAAKSLKEGGLGGKKGDFLVGLGIGLLVFLSLSFGSSPTTTTTATAAGSSKAASTTQVPATVNPPIRAATSSTSTTSTTTAATPKTISNSSPNDGLSVGLTVNHCSEKSNEMGWIEEVPPHWHFVIYELCGRKQFGASKRWKSDGNDECTGFVQTIIDQYDNLPDVTIFLQQDAFIGYGAGAASKTYQNQRTPFKSLQELFDATLKHSRTWKEPAFLHYGRGALTLENVNAKDPFNLYNTREVLDIFQIPYLKNHERIQADDATHTKTKAGHYFAVSRDSIRSRPLEHYKALLASVSKVVAENRNDGNAGRRRCCALENLWHVIFGQPLELPSQNTVDRLWSDVHNYYSGTWGEELERRQQRQQQ